MPQNNTMNDASPALAAGGVRSPSDAEAVTLLEDAVRTPSLSGDESRVAALLVERMSSFGFDAEVDPAGNAVGVLGDRSPGAAEIVLLGHMDVVPGVVPVRREGDLLFGRGTVDAKGPLCAFVIAAARATAAGLPPGVRLVVAGVVEEESASSKGARHIAASRRPAACFIGEPSHHDGVTLGYKGRLLLEFVYRLTVAHTSRPDASAAELAAEWWRCVPALAREKSLNGKTVFDSIQASLRAFNTSSDGLHDEARLTIGFRLPPGVDPHEIESACRTLAPSDAQITASGHEVAHVADRNNPVVRALTTSIRAAGLTPAVRVKTGTSDMNVVAPIWKCPIAAYGPGDSALDHTPQEHVSVTEYLSAIGVLTGALGKLGAELAETHS